jgi:hypothetical protein
VSTAVVFDAHVSTAELMSTQAAGGATIDTGVFDEPVTWAVLVLYDGEVLGNIRDLYTSEPAVRARLAELRYRYPRHDIRAVRRTVVWTEEDLAEDGRAEP